MKKIMCEDCNNNSLVMQDILNETQAFEILEINWRVSNVELIPIDTGDSNNGVLNEEMSKIYNFQKRMLDEHLIIMQHNQLIDILKNTKTVYGGTFISQTEDKNKITVFDGDIIVLEGRIEKYSY